MRFDSICVGLAVSLVFLQSCVHGEKKETGDVQAFVQGQQTADPTDLTCPPEPRPCTEEWNPTRCLSESAGEELLVLRGRIIAFGDNLCLAREKLRVSACNAGLKPGHLGNISCVPDASQARCGGPAEDCKDAPGLPTVCRLTRYNNQDLTPTSLVAGFGKNECEARADLTRELCAANLDPMHINNVTCEADQTGGECPPSTLRCPQTVSPSRCRVTLASASSKNLELSSWGRNLCEAQAKLRGEACKHNRKPSVLPPVTCEASTEESP
jgi:hypothetical protein